MAKWPAEQTPSRDLACLREAPGTGPAKELAPDQEGAELTIGLDIGTSAVKAVAVDSQGRIRARARVPYPMHIGAADTFEHDPAEVWQGAPLLALSKLGTALDRATGLGVAACVPSLVALDDKILPLSRGLLYGDRRGRQSAPGAPGRLVQRNPLDAREGEAFLRWASRRWPGARAYWPAQALAMVSLGGKPVIDVFTAMTFFPVFNGKQWDPVRLVELGITEDQLPHVIPEIGRPAGEIAAGGPAGNPMPIVLTPGGVDVVAEQVTAGVNDPGDVHVICGATLLTWAVMPDGGEVHGLWRIPHFRAGLCFVGGPSNAGGLFLDWALGLIGAADGQGALRPDSIPLWIPYVRGERTPLNDDSLRSSLHGLDLTHGAAALRRAAYEAAGFVVRHHLDLAGCVPSRIVATGGGVQDDAWMQALADCTGAAVVRSAVPESAALGMAWLARMAAGREFAVSDAQRWFRTRRPIYPDEQWVDACSRRYEIFRAVTAEHPPC